ncbi:MAG: PAS domain-containing protein, partial [Ignavibacteriae bacterium]|nr:PAS domain-containing protein [Ignavibacteriota bacterium]
LKNMMLDLYVNKLQKEHDIVQLQFHTPPAVSFLRLHKPSKFGDDLSSFRETVVSANLNKKIVSGIEVGRGGPGLRVVFPVAQNGSHIGTVEFGLGIGNIISGINSALKVDYAIGIKKEVFEKAKRFEDKESDVINSDVIFYEFSDASLKQMIAKKSLNNEIQKFELNGKNFASYSFPITDYANNEAGFIVLYRDITPNIKAMYSSLLFSILIIMVLSVIVSSVLAWSMTNKVVKPIEIMSEAANLFSSGNKNVNFEVSSNDELGVLSRSLKNMALKINTQLQYLDNLPTPVTIIDKDFKVQYINNAAASFSGLKQNEAIGKQCNSLFDTPHCGTENCGCLKAMELGKPVTSETISSSNEQKRPIMYTGAPIRNDKGEIIGALESTAETTEMKEKEKYLARSTQKLLLGMNRFASGDLTVKVLPEKNDDHIGDLFNGFNNAVLNIKSLIFSLSDSISATASASAEISSSAEVLAAGSQEQSSQTNEVASAVEEMAVTVVETTKNVTIAADAAKDAGFTAAEGGKVIQNTIIGI